jgi:putative flippase GtrA
MNSKAFLHFLKFFVFYSFSFILILGYLFLIAWTFCYSLYVCYLLTAALIASVIIFCVNRSKRQSVKFLLLGIVLFMLLSPFNIKQYNRHAEALHQRVSNKQELNTKERLGIYGCLIMVTVFDIVPFPEFAKQNFYLFFPVEDKQRVFYSNSILNSPSITREVKRKTTGSVSWNRWSSIFDPDFRFALAFQNCRINTVRKNGYREVIVSTNFHYRKDMFSVHANHVLHGIFAFRVDEGLFWYLQEKGWLHPYTANWIAKLEDE